MRAHHRLFGFIAVLFMFLSLPQLNAEQEISFFDPEKTISMDFQDARIKDILKIFSMQSGLNFIASEALQDRAVTLYLDNVPIKDAMNKIFRANNLSYELDKDSDIFIVKDWGKATVETLTKVFYLKHATVSSSSLKKEMSSASSVTDIGTGEGAGGGEEGSGKWGTEDDVGITNAIKKLLSSDGSLIEDWRTNSLVVTDIPSRMPVIAQVIASLDVAIPQVLIEVEMLDVSKSTTDKLGFKFGSQPLAMSLTGAAGTVGFPFEKWTKTFLTDANRGSIAINQEGAYKILLEFLKTQSDTKYLARPRLLTLNNETAEIKIATNESIGVRTTTSSAEGSASTSVEPERSETGTILRVTPQVNTETGEITMFLYPKVAESVTGNTFVVAGANYTYRDPEERSTKTTVRVKDGETIIIGGLIRTEFSETITKVPVLGDIPVLGSLFRHRSKERDRERELLVFITPHVIKDKNIELAEAKKIVLPQREQSAIMGVNRQLAVQSSLNGFENKKK